MLHLIGIGNKKEHVNFEMKEVISKCSKVFLEYYTSFYEDSFEELEKFLDKKIVICDRKAIEIEIEEKIIKPAKKEEVAILVLGDPLIATTHTDLLIRCREMKVETKIYSNVSVLNHLARTGLSMYKIGKITSIPFFSKKFMPRTPLMYYLDNHRMGAHSVFLLDLKPDEGKYLGAGEALNFLLDVKKLMLDNEELLDKDGDALDIDTDVVVCSRLGYSDERIVYDTIEDVVEIDRKEKFKAPLCLIIPGDMHEMEEKFLEKFKKKKSKK
jgi:diphthine synthase